MRKYFIGTFTAKVASLTLTQELEQFPALEESCNTDINDDFIGTSFIHMCTEYTRMCARTHTHNFISHIPIHNYILFHISIHNLFYIPILIIR